MEMKRLWKRCPLVTRTGRIDSSSNWRLGGFASSQDKSETSNWTKLGASVRIAGWDLREEIPQKEEDVKPKSKTPFIASMEERTTRVSKDYSAFEGINPILIEVATLGPSPRQTTTL